MKLVEEWQSRTVASIRKKGDFYVFGNHSTRTHKPKKKLTG